MSLRDEFVDWIVDTALMWIEEGNADVGPGLVEDAIAQEIDDLWDDMRNRRNEILEKIRLNLE